MENKIINIEIDRLLPHPQNPRKNLGDLSELAESIKKNGILQNLTVVRADEDKYTVIIGHRRCAAAKLAGLAEKKYSGLKCELYSIRNDFFGETITVSGLITATDILKQLENKNLGTELLISSSMLRRDTDVFLDDLTVSDVENRLNVKIIPVENDGFALLDAILGISL